MIPGMRLAALLLVAMLSAGCGQLFYARTPVGAFSGKLIVEWIEPNVFIYRPDMAAPLVYTTSDGRRIQPRTMYTDGGSIPRLFWSAPGLGPWDFAPGYIIHDWLFEQRHCREGDWQAYDFERSASILAEALKSQMVKSGSAEPTILWAVHEAVSTEFARNLWENGKCRPPVVAPAAAPGFPAKKPVPIRVIEF